MADSVEIKGTYAPCFSCHYPAVISLNGVQANPPGGITVWKDGNSNTRITPHSEGCVGPVEDPVRAAFNPHAARPAAASTPQEGTTP
jgi:hypothetical protein